MRGATAVAFALFALGALAPPARAQDPGPPKPELTSIVRLDDDVVRYRFRYGPLVAGPGQDVIMPGPVTIEKPGYDGYMVGFRPDLLTPDGQPSRGGDVHLHHAIWLNARETDRTAPNLPERFAASGEEKTRFYAPRDEQGDPKYGYLIKGTDTWLLSYMLHNQTSQSKVVWIAYDLDYVPSDSELGRRIKPLQPVWLDVCNGSAYPVFDVRRAWGGEDGRYVYPDDATDNSRKYADCIGRPSSWRVDQAGTLIRAGGHVHPGGLYTDLEIARGGERKLIFRSTAEYFDPSGPISWDFAQTVAPDSWKIRVQRGDVLSLKAVYETEHGSWYEGMGGMIAFMAPPEDGATDPFTEPVDIYGETTHGHLPENSDYGGEPTNLPDPRQQPDGLSLKGPIVIGNFLNLPGNIGMSDPLGRPPTVARGETIRFVNADSPAHIFHTVTSCKAPCTAEPGISYPLADGEVDFDSGELGYGPPGYTPAKNDATWQLDTASMDPGTYTYFCRIHPFMRGAFRVK